jgi:glutamine cyclotransferase
MRCKVSVAPREGRRVDVNAGRSVASVDSVNILNDSQRCCRHSKLPNGVAVQSAKHSIANTTRADCRHVP